MSNRPSLSGKALRGPATLTMILAQVGGLFGAQVFTSTPSLDAQETPPSSVPSAFSKLEGAWEGSGVLLDRPAEFQMKWEVMGSGFVRLTFSNAWVKEGGSLTPVLSSQAVYYLDGSSAIGVWLDDRPQRLTLQASVTDSSVVTHWTAATEEGRTEYLIRSPEVVVVRDFVGVNGAERLFAEATFRRRDSEAPAGR